MIKKVDRRSEAAIMGKYAKNAYENTPSVLWIQMDAAGSMFKALFIY